MLLISVFCLLIWISRSYTINEVEEVHASDNLEILFWNSQHSKGLKEAFEANQGVPELCVLVECNMESTRYAEQNFPNSHFYLSEEGIGVFSKKPISKLNEVTSKDNSTILSFDYEGCAFYAIDISASLFNNRRHSFSFLKSELRAKTNVVVLGDFNTPIESMHYSFLKSNFNNVFEVKGNGFRETWFWNIPVLALDHIWVSNDLSITETEKINTWESDHSLIRTKILVSKGSTMNFGSPH
ncbi:MAG: endonuclease/exonuclease/phosphatase family protein [Jejuia sp.]